MSGGVNEKRNGRFQNTLSVQNPPMGPAIGKWLKGAKHTTPKGPYEVERRTARDYDAPPESGLRITWLGHSTFIAELDGVRLLVDPVFGDRASPLGFSGPKRFHEPPLPLDELPEIDAVVISHNHYDHLDASTIRALGERVPRYVVPLGVGAYLERWGVAGDRITERGWWQSATVGDIVLTATPARHFSGRTLLDRDRSLWSGWVLAGPTHRVYYSGDTGMFPGFSEIGERLGPFDAVLIEIGAYDELWADLHIGPEQAVDARVAVGSGLLIPVHWGTFNLAMHAWTEPVERLLVAAGRAGVPVAVPRPGQRVEPATPPQVTRWWPEVPWKTAEESPVVSSGLEVAPEG